MKIILVTDIFGLTDHLLGFQQRITKSGVDCDIVDPYLGVNRQLTSEPLAYQTFMAECGHEHYCDLVKSKVEAANSPVVIGFSAGASAAWKVLDKVSHDAVLHFIGFYPSQIRHHVDVCPSSPVSLIFPAVETHFDVNAVIEHLSQKPLVMISQTQYCHGFINYYSSAYDEVASAQYIKLLSNSQLLSDPQLMQTALAQLSSDH
jgi:dienelactone hydrolase